ncbi:MAG: crossover junction endodeoxyribonuclease RuvC [Patescibacteria group bacterium]
MRVVGIDPGTHRIGYALVEGERLAPRLRHAETIVLDSRTTAERLSGLEKALDQRLRRDRADIVAVEKVFFEKNTKTALAVAEARGIIILTASRHVSTIGEYTPPEVKMAVTGYGRADKSQVRRMVRLLLPGAAIPSGDDAVDAIALAITALLKITPLQKS